MTGTSTPAATAPCRVAVAGASGRMGRMLIEAIRATDDLVLAGALDVPASPGIGSTPRRSSATPAAWPSRPTSPRASKTPTC